MTKKKKKKKYWKFRLFFKIQLVFLILLLAAGACYVFGGYGKEVKALKKEAEKLVRDSNVETFRENQASIFYDAAGNVLSTLKGEKESYYLEYKDIPVNAIAAIVSIEDKKFYRHDGVDYAALVRAGKSILENGKITQGGSTITMQLARNIFISQEKTWQRKVEEMYIAWNLEKKYTKNQIIEFYMNNIYFGNGYYGIQSASRGYFNRDVGQLSLSEIAFLCAIPNNPTLYDPITNMDNTLSRRDRILTNMKEDGKISNLAYANAVVEDIQLERPQSAEKNDYAETYAYYCATRALMEMNGFTFCNEFASEEEEEAYDAAYAEAYSECQRKLYTEGYEIHTSLNLNLQEELQTAVDDTLSGFLEVNDEGVYELQASAVCINNDTGYVEAIVGGRKQDFAGYTLNRGYQSFRQPGSAIKPLLVYTPLLERGMTPDSVVVDEPIEDGPKNANGTYIGQTTLRTAVEKSINTVAWRLYEELSPEAGLSYLKKMNFSKIDAADYRLATALGGFTNGTSALEMASGYAALANDGKYRTPTCVVKILNASGRQVYASEQEEQVIYRQNAARMMTDMLTGVFTNGTARGLGLSNMPCAGKTGTTNDQKDGWCVGYTRYYTTSVWVGYDMPRKLEGLMGSTYPGKIWKSFMETAHQGMEALPFLPYVQMSDEYQSFMQPENGEEGMEEGVLPENPDGIVEEGIQPENPDGIVNEGVQPEQTPGSGGEIVQPEQTPGSGGEIVQPEQTPGSGGEIVQPEQTPGNGGEIVQPEQTPEAGGEIVQPEQTPGSGGEIVQPEQTPGAGAENAVPEIPAGADIAN